MYRLDPIRDGFPGQRDVSEKILTHRDNCVAEKIQGGPGRHCKIEHGTRIPTDNFVLPAALPVLLMAHHVVLFSAIH